MRERFDYTAQVAEKLIAAGAIAPESVEIAATTLAGLLDWLWSSQNVAHLADEMIEGQVGVVRLLVESLAQPWTDEDWFQPLWTFDAETRSSLATLEDLSYDDALYPAIDRVITGIDQAARGALDEVGRSRPERACEARAWVLGSLIRNNHYSWADGSVPEDIGDRLGRIQGRLSAESEGAFYPWLNRGFRSVREAALDELSRWRYGIEPIHAPT